MYHSVHESEWCLNHVPGLKTNYWDCGTQTVIWSKITGGYFKFLVDSVVTHNCSCKIKLKWIKCCWVRSWTNNSTTANCQLYFEVLNVRDNWAMVFYSAKIQYMCRMYLAIFLPLKTTKTVNNKRWTTSGRTNGKHSTVFFTKHPIHFRRPQEFHSFVYTVYVVRKKLGSIIIWPLRLKLTLSQIFMETVCITSVATLVEGKNLRYNVFTCILVCFSCVFSNPTSNHVPL